MSTCDIPVLELDADVYPIGGEYRLGEPGTFTFARDLALHLEGLLRGPVTGLLHRENPWYRRACAKAWTYECVVGGHRILVTSYETTAPLVRGPVTAYGVAIDGRTERFDRPNLSESLAWQLARHIWLTLTDAPNATTGGLA
jgi:hypothetical protein